MFAPGVVGPRIETRRLPSWLVCGTGAGETSALRPGLEVGGEGKPPRANVAIMPLQKGDQVRRIDGDRTELGTVIQPLGDYADVLWPGPPGPREQRELVEQLEVVNPA